MFTNDLGLAPTFYLQNLELIIQQDYSGASRRGRKNWNVVRFGINTNLAACATSKRKKSGESSSMWEKKIFYIQKRKDVTIYMTGYLVCMLYVVCCICVCAVS